MAGFGSALVGLDLSRVSDALVEWLPVLRRVGTERLVLLHVISVEVVEHVAGGYDVTGLEDALRRAALERLRGYKSRLEASGFRVEVPEPPVGEPGATIARAASGLGVDYIVVASRGHSLLRSILIGSTTEEVLHAADRPVLVARVRVEGGEPGVAGDPFKGPILVALAFDDYSSVVLECASQIAARTGARLVLLHVYEEGEAAAVAAKALEGSAGRARGIGVESVETVAVSGRPAKAILEQASKRGASLIVMGPHSRRGLPFIGSVADQVARRAPTHVLVCK